MKQIIKLMAILMLLITLTGCIEINDGEKTVKYTLDITDELIPQIKIKEPETKHQGPATYEDHNSCLKAFESLSEDALKDIKISVNCLCKYINKSGCISDEKLKEKNLTNASIYI